MVQVTAPGLLGHEAGRREGRSQGRAAASGAQTAQLSCRSISEWAGAREVFAVESAGHLSACAHQTREARVPRRGGRAGDVYVGEGEPHPLPCTPPHSGKGSYRASVARPGRVRGSRLEGKTASPQARVWQD